MQTASCCLMCLLSFFFFFFKIRLNCVWKPRCMTQVFLSTGAEECYQQSETVLCPLCRHPWINEAVTAHSQTHHIGELDCKQRVSTDHHWSTFNSVCAAMITKQVKKSHCRTLESELPCTHSPGAVSPLTSFGSGSSGYKSLSSDSAQEALQEVLAEAGVIPSEQLPAASEWAKV
jgi:hypothetical protein